MSWSTAARRWKMRLSLSPMATRMRALEGLNQSIQQEPIETPIPKLDAILVMLDERVHGPLLCGEIPGAYWRERLCSMAISKPARTFQDLLVWQKAHQFVLGVYALTAAFPKQETYGLSMQLRRASVSIPANIAEGFRRRGKADKARFMNMAEGSVEECRYFLILAKDLGYGDTEKLSGMLEEVSRLLGAYAAAILASGS